MDFQSARDYILNRLEHELNHNLIYHSYAHTIDVYRAASRLSSLEGLSDEETRLVETAALYHDAGMLTGYQDHEEESALLAAEALKQYNYSPDQIEIIKDMIISTRLPQMASSTKGKILCDADMDYLGRDDFFIISFKLKLEWQLFGIRDYSLSDWFVLQENFLKNHVFLSDSARKLRNEGKMKNLSSIRLLIKQ